MPESVASVLPLQADALRMEHGGRVLLSVDSLSVAKGEFVCVVGPNGAGKTLLLKALAGLNGATNSSIRWGASQPSRAGYCRLAMLLQQPVLLRRSVRANLEYALKSLSGLGLRARRDKAQKTLAAAGMQHLSSNSARLLSGGEKQRLALLRALINEPEVLLLDEPTASLDPASTAWFEQQLLAVHQQGLSVVMVTHDLNQARRLASRVVLLHRGELVEDTAKTDFFNAPQSAEARAYLAGELLF